jgi:hypothetical protein
VESGGWTYGVLGHDAHLSSSAAAGRYLHGAPAELVPPAAAASAVRLTLLVNVWLHHVPRSTTLLPPHLLRALPSSSLPSAKAKAPKAPKAKAKAQRERAGEEDPVRMRLHAATVETPVVVPPPKPAQRTVHTFLFGGADGARLAALPPRTAPALASRGPRSALSLSLSLSERPRLLPRSLAVFSGDDHLLTLPLPPLKSLYKAVQRGASTFALIQLAGAALSAPAEQQLEQRDEEEEAAAYANSIEDPDAEPAVSKATDANRAARRTTGGGKAVGGHWLGCDIEETKIKAGAKAGGKAGAGAGERKRTTHAAKKDAPAAAEAVYDFDEYDFDGEKNAGAAVKARKHAGGRSARADTRTPKKAKAAAAAAAVAVARSPAARRALPTPGQPTPKPAGKKTKPTQRTTRGAAAAAAEAEAEADGDFDSQPRAWGSSCVPWRPRRSTQPAAKRARR